MKRRRASPTSVPRPPGCDIFCSLRLREAKEQALELKAAIEAARPDVACFVSGDNPNGAYIDEIISDALVGCRLAVIMGSRTYGQRTKSTFSTFQELQYILETPKPFCLVKMCDKFEESTTQLKLGSNIKFKEWLLGAPMPDGLVDEILSKLDKCTAAAAASSSGAPRPAPPPATAAASLPAMPEAAAPSVPVLRHPPPRMHGVDAVPPTYARREEREEFLVAKLLGADATGVALVGAGSQGAAAAGQAAGGAVGVAATAGSGKSTMARWVAHDARVQQRFHDGILYLRFGQERTAVELLRELGEELATALRVPRREAADALGRARDERALARIVKELVDGSATALCEQLPRDAEAHTTTTRDDRAARPPLHVLMILDDVWHVSQLKPFKALQSPTASLLLTTRKSRVAAQLDRVDLEQLPEEASRSLLAHASGKTLDELRGADPSDLAYLLKRCSGLPLMLHSVGRMCGREGVASVAAYFRRQRAARRKPEAEEVQEEGYEEYETYFDALELQLAGLDPELPRRCTMLAVWREDDTVPLDMLERLWQVDAAEAEGCVRRLEAESLVQRRAEGIELLDVHRDYFACCAKAELAGWHAQLLRRCGVTEIGEEECAVSYWRGTDGGRRFLHHLGCAKLRDGSELGVQTLTLRNNSAGDAGAAALASALEKNASLQTLDLRANSVGEAGAAALASALEKNASLQKLWLGDNSVGVAGASALASALEKNASLQTLYLNDNSVGDAGAAVLATALEKNAALQTLYLSTNSVGDAGASALATALEKNASLQTLYLDHNSVGDAGASALASALEKNASLQELYLEQNSVGDAGAVSLASALEKNASLQKLDLSYNSVGDAGAASLASALEKNASLQKLDLSFNSVGDAGAASLASALEKNASLLELVAYENDVGDAGAASLASALEENASLQVLDLNDNSVGDAGAASLASALEKNASLLKLDLSANLVGDAGAASLASALEKNTSLRVLNIWGDELGDAGAASLAAVREKNPFACDIRVVMY